jgi:hypothetical protein
MMARLFIESINQTVEEMEAQIGIKSDSSWRKGASRGTTGKQFVTSSWQLEESYNSADDAESVVFNLGTLIGKVLHRMYGYEEHFRIASTGEISGFLINISSGAVPPLIIEPDHLRGLVSLGVPVEIDLILA